MCLFINGIDHILANSIYCCITQSASRQNANSGPLSRWLWVAPRGLAGTASLQGSPIQRASRNPTQFTKHRSFCHPEFSGFRWISHPFDCLSIYPTIRLI